VEAVVLQVARSQPVCRRRTTPQVLAAPKPTSSSKMINAFGAP
jgi:hypothetical protein